MANKLLLAGYNEILRWCLRDSRRSYADAASTSSNAYQTGFGNEFATEALPGTLPIGRNSPQQVAHGLYAEQLSGTAFTAPRAENRRSWLYRIRPAAMHGTFAPFVQPALPQRLRHRRGIPRPVALVPLPLPDATTDFVEGLFTMAGNGSAATQHGIGIHLYAANRSTCRVVTSTTPMANC